MNETERQQGGDEERRRAATRRAARRAAGSAYMRRYAREREEGEEERERRRAEILETWDREEDAERAREEDAERAREEVREEEVREERQVDLEAGRDLVRWRREGVRDRLNEEEEGAARDLARWRRVEGFGEGGRDRQNEELNRVQVSGCGRRVIDAIRRACRVGGWRGMESAEDSGLEMARHDIRYNTY